MQFFYYTVALLMALAAACGGEIGTGSLQQLGADAAPIDASETILVDAQSIDAPPLLCDAGDLQSEGIAGSCYWAVYSGPVDRTTARAACQADGGDLAIIKSANESDEVNNLAIAAMTASGDVVVDYWIGASDADVEGVFVWQDGSSLDFENWRLDEPNNGGLAGEDCSLIEADRGGSWDDRPCDADPEAGVSPIYGYVCER